MLLIEGMLVIIICHPTKCELESCKMIGITTDMEWHPELINENDWTPDKNEIIYDKRIE